MLSSNKFSDLQYAASFWSWLPFKTKFNTIDVRRITQITASMTAIMEENNSVRLITKPRSEKQDLDNKVSCKPREVYAARRCSP